MIALLLASLLQEPPPPPPRPPRARPPAVEEDPVFKRDAEEQPPPRAPQEPRRGPGGPELRLTPALEEVKAWLREHEPEAHRRVERAIEEGRRPEAARLLMDAEPRMREMAELKNRDPKAYEKAQELRRLERESLDVAARARGASPADREAAAKMLREKLDRLFDLREEQKARELDELKRRVAEIEKQLDARKASKDRIVDRRKRELLGERLQDDW
jgi:hypothetical protein